ncbi:MAG: hypothetical protein PVH29_14805 [Candidatus Zixiibacteriota bacterium]|jgi:hypothetical protein
MITKAIIGVKTALLDLEDQDGTSVFSTADQIYTGYPHPDLIRPDMPTIKNPVVAVYFKGKDASGLGFQEFLIREDATVEMEEYRRDRFFVTQIDMTCDVHILAGTMDEIVGTASPSWNGYVQQVITIVRSHAGIVGLQDTQIRWDLASEDIFEIPGAVDYAADRRAFLGIVRSVLYGKVLEPVGAKDYAPIEELNPHDGEFTPTYP